MNKPLLLLVVAVAITLGGCQRWKTLRCPRDYTVAVTYLPKKLDPRHNQINVYHYIILQLYHPLMSRVGAGLVSEFLDLKASKATSKDLSSYQLCLKDGVTFTDGSVITVGDLSQSLINTHSIQEMLSPLASAEIIANCVAVKLTRPDPDYFDKLTTASSTVIKMGTEDQKLPVGLGPYRVEEWDEAHIRLSYRGQTTNIDFPTVTFKIVYDLDEAIKDNLMDMNLMYWEPKRSQRLAAWPQIHHQMMRTYAVIVSIPNEKVRKQFTGCFDRNKYLKAAMSLELVPIPGFLPEGTPGSDVSFSDVQQGMAHKPCSGTPGPVTRYVNQVWDDLDNLKYFFSEEQDRLPVNVKVENRSRAELIEMFSSWEVMIYTIGIDSVNSQAAQFGEPSVFFETFFRDNRHIAERLHDVEAAVRAALLTDDRDAKAYHYRDAHKKLLESGYVIPLGQMPPVLYYSPCVKQIEFADPVIGYPRIDWITRQGSSWEG